jgi:hypothetical protein
MLPLAAFAGDVGAAKDQGGLGHAATIAEARVG